MAIWKPGMNVAQISWHLSYGGGEECLGFPNLWSGQKPLLNWYLTPCGEFRWSPEGTVSQIHSSHLHAGAPGFFADLLRSVQMVKIEWSVESNGKLPSKTAAWIPGFCCGRPAFEHNCGFGSWVYSEGPSLGQSTRMNVLRLRKNPAKNLKREIDLTGDWIRARCVRNNDVTPRPQRWSRILIIRTQTQ